jgi:hypothetical protein
LTGAAVTWPPKIATIPTNAAKKKKKKKKKTGTSHARAEPKVGELDLRVRRGRRVQQVLRLEVAVRDRLAVQVVHGTADLGDKVRGVLLRVRALFNNPVKELAAVHKLHHKIPAVALEVKESVCYRIFWGLGFFLFLFFCFFCFLLCVVLLFFVSVLCAPMLQIRSIFRRPHAQLVFVFVDVVQLDNVDVVARVQNVALGQHTLLLVAQLALVCGPKCSDCFANAIIGEDWG